MKADLHLHTWYSDGTEAPAEMIRRAARLGFGAAGITDHDTVDGIPEAMEEGKRLGVLVIPGVEVTSRLGPVEIHMLLYFNPACGSGAGWRHPDLKAELAEQNRNRTNRIRGIVQRLSDLGVPLKADDVLHLAARSERGEGAPIAAGRPHVARALVAAGAASSVDDAFRRYLRRGAPAFVDKERPEAVRVLDLARRAGGLAILAHPGIACDDRLPDDLRRLGVDGIEAIHSRHSGEARERYLRFAREHGLLATGGSDCHGALKGEPLLGTMEFAGEELDAFLARVRALPS